VNRKTPMLSEDDVRETPPELFNPLHEKVGFTIDVAASHDNAKCGNYYTEDGQYWVCETGIIGVEGMNGLTGDWIAHKVWCNPPFSQMDRWVSKAWKSTGAESVHMLSPATRTEQGWWQRMVEPYRDGRKSFQGWVLRTQFLPGRTNFLKNGKPIINAETGNKSGPKFGCCLLIWEHE